MNVKVFLLGFVALAGTSLIFFGMNQGMSFDEPSLSATAQFFTFKAKYGKEYSSAAELEFRLKIFADTLEKISAHNADLGQSYTLGVNEFSDMTFAEFRAKYLEDFLEIRDDSKCYVPTERIPSENDSASEVDWVVAGKVREPKTQGKCRSSYAFATVAAIESAYAIYKNVDVPDISEQELIDCSWDYRNNGCSSGMAISAYSYILDHQINSREKYPYVEKEQTCNQSLVDKGEFEINRCYQPISNVEGLIEAVRKQPVTVVFSVQDDFMSYSGGIYNHKNCTDYPYHNVLTVGFKLDGDLPYFRVKNSWGTGWGEKGYFRVFTGEGNGTCDIAGTGWNAYPAF